MITPLEKAKRKQKEKKERCNDTTIIDGVLYCNKSGKIILPLFTENGENKVCDIKKCKNRKVGAV